MATTSTTQVLADLDKVLAGLEVSCNHRVHEIVVRGQKIQTCHCGLKREKVSS